MAEYPILTPRLGYAEQDPEEWWRATKIAVRKALEKAGHPEILGIGFSGQMHGLILLDQRKRLVRPAINLGRSTKCRFIARIKRTRRCISSGATMRDSADNGIFDFLVILAAKI
jgi:sugar (pentulose or hexulose) kinase